MNLAVRSRSCLWSARVRLFGPSILLGVLLQPFIGMMAVRENTVWWTTSIHGYHYVKESYGAVVAIHLSTCFDVVRLIDIGTDCLRGSVELCALVLLAL